MFKGRWVLWSALAVASVGLPVAGVAHALPRLQQVFAYTSEATAPAARAALEGEFRWATGETCRPDVAACSGDPIELSHSTLRAPGRVRSTTRPNMGAIEVRIDVEADARPDADAGSDSDAAVRAVFFTPFRWRGRDGLWDPVVGVIGSSREGGSDPFAGVGEEMGYSRAEWPGVASFEWNASAALTTIMPAERAWDLTEREFLRVFLRTIFKAMDPANENGGLVLETDDARAIVRFGRADKPTRVHVAVWARRGDLSQGFFVDGPDAATARRVATELAKSWRPTRLLGPSAAERVTLRRSVSR